MSGESARTAFRDIPVGRYFDFVGPDGRSASGFYDRCRKVSDRRYTFRGYTATVGTVAVAVHHVREED